MSVIKSNTDLINDYNGISRFCHNYAEPIFVTKNGKCDLAVMSIEVYEQLTVPFELYNLIKDGMQDIKNGDTKPFTQAMADIRDGRKR